METVTCLKMKTNILLKSKQRYIIETLKISREWARRTNLMPFVLLSKTGISPNVFNFDAQIKDAIELQIKRK